MALSLVVLHCSEIENLIWKTGCLNFELHSEDRSETGGFSRMSSALTRVPYHVILILFLMGLAIPGGLATLMVFLAYSTRRRKKKRGAPRYVVVSHPHI